MLDLVYVLLGVVVTLCVQAVLYEHEEWKDRKEKHDSKERMEKSINMMSEITLEGEE